MNTREKEILKYCLTMYKDQWDRNDYARSNYDEDLEYYRGYRNANDYPLAYNIVYNRLLPIVYQLLARFMDQLYQSGNIVSVKPRKKRDIERAKKVEATLNFQLESLNDIDMQGGSYLTMMKWMFNNITFGKGIVKAYWRKEERISPRRIALPIPNFDRLGNFQGYDILDYLNEEMQTLYDGPYVEVLHNKTFVPHPEYKSIQLMPSVFLVYKKSIDYIKKMANKGVYLSKNVKDLGWDSSGGAGLYASDSEESIAKSLGIEGALTKPDEKHERKAPSADILECYTKLIFEDTPYEVGSGVKIKGYEEEAIIHIGNYNTILSIQKNTYGVRPLFDMGWYMQPELYWDLGIIRLSQGIQEQINTMANLRTQNAMMMVNQMMKVNVDADIDPKALTWKPFGLVPVQEMDDVEPLVVPDMHSNLFMEQENFYEASIQDLTGMYSYNMGQTPQRQERVGVVHSIQTMGEARAKLMLMSMDFLGIRPLLKYMMILNTFHLPSGFEYRITDKDNQEGQGFGMLFGDDIHPDFDFAARYTAMEPALGKQFRAQQLIQMAQMWTQSPWINQYQMAKTMMELLDIREADLLLKSPQQFMQEMQQQQKAAMMQQQQEVQAETQGKLRISAQDFQEDIALNEQEFGHDMALEALKQEATSEGAS